MCAEGCNEQSGWVERCLEWDFLALNSQECRSEEDQRVIKPNLVFFTNGKN